MSKEAPFTPAKPSLVLTGTSGSVTVVTKLYGDVSPARLEREKKEVQYRAEQLAPAPVRVRRERQERVDKFSALLDEFDAFDAPREQRSGRRWSSLD